MSQHKSADYFTTNKTLHSSLLVRKLLQKKEVFVKLCIFDIQYNLMKFMKGSSELGRLDVNELVLSKTEKELIRLN